MIKITISWVIWTKWRLHTLWTTHSSYPESFILIWCLQVSFLIRVCTVLVFSGFWAFRAFPKIIRVSVRAFSPFSIEGSDWNVWYIFPGIADGTWKFSMLLYTEMWHDKKQLELRNPYQYLKCKFLLKCINSQKCPTFLNILPFSEQELA